MCRIFSFLVNICRGIGFAVYTVYLFLVLILRGIGIAVFGIPLLPVSNFLGASVL